MTIIHINSLTDEQKAKVVRLKRECSLTDQTLANRFGVSQGVISRVLSAAGLTKHRKAAP